MRMRMAKALGILALAFAVFVLIVGNLAAHQLGGGVAMLLSGVIIGAFVATPVAAVIAYALVAGSRERTPPPQIPSSSPRWYAEQPDPDGINPPWLLTPSTAQMLNNTAAAINAGLRRRGLSAWVNGGKYAGVGMEFAIRLGTGTRVNDVKAALQGLPNSIVAQSGTHVILRVRLPQAV